jgi:hypothetical protein
VYVARYFERVRIDANSLTENRLVIKLLWTAFGLYRELEVINEKIQNVDIVADLINSVSYFYFMFCMYDESLTWRSEEQLRNRNWASPQTGSIITGSLERYAALSKWFRTGEKLSDIDGNAFYIPVGEFKEKCRELKEILGDLTHNLLGIMAEGSR